MSTVNVGRNGRVYQRKFDHEQARARHAAGETMAALAREYGVSPAAVRRAVDDKFRVASDARTSARLASGVCPDCGAPCTNRPGTTCVPCRDRKQATSVRDGELRCQRCREWKPDDAFPHNSAKKCRRGRHGVCRGCQPAMRREARHSQQRKQAA